MVYDYLITRALLAQIRLFGSSLLNYGWKGRGQLKILKPGILRDADARYQNNIIVSQARKSYVAIFVDN